MVSSKWNIYKFWFPKYVNNRIFKTAVETTLRVLYPKGVAQWPNLKLRPAPLMRIYKRHSETPQKLQSQDHYRINIYTIRAVTSHNLSIKLMWVYYIKVIVFGCCEFRRIWVMDEGRGRYIALVEVVPATLQLFRRGVKLM